LLIHSLCRQVPEQSSHLILRFHKAAPAALQAPALAAAQIPEAEQVEDSLQPLEWAQAPALAAQAGALQALAAQPAEAARLPAALAAQAQAVRPRLEIPAAAQQAQRLAAKVVITNALYFTACPF